MADEREQGHRHSEHITLSFDRSAMELFRVILLGIRQDIVDGFVNNTKHLNRIERNLSVVHKQGVEIMADLAQLEAAVAEETTVQQGAITLLTKLADMVKAAGTDPVKLQAVIAQITNNKAALAAAIVANTPSAEEPPIPEGRRK